MLALLTHKQSKVFNAVVSFLYLEKYFFMPMHFAMPLNVPGIELASYVVPDLLSSHRICLQHLLFKPG